MSAFKLENMGKKMGATLLQNKGGAAIEYLLTDSRTLLFAPTTCFFALVSARNNGHKYLEELYQKGVRNFVVSQKVDLSHLPMASVLLVENTVDALQYFATEKRKMFKGVVVAITGSNGKTIVKEWLYQVLQKQFFISRSPKSYNSQIGVALSMWNMDPNADIILVEAGISLPGEMKKLEQMIRPDVVVFTNLGPAHQENFSSLQQKAAEKAVLAHRARQVFYCSDYPVLEEAIKQVVPDDARFSWTFKDGECMSATVDTFHDYSAICLMEQSDTLLYTIPFTDEASIENSLHVCCLSRHLGMPPDVLTENLARLEPVEMRLQMKNGINGCKIINDTYNSDILSLGIALDFLVQQAGDQELKKTLVLSDIQQSEKSPAELYAEVGHWIERKQIDRLIGVGDAVKQHLQSLSVESEFYSTTLAFLEEFKPERFANEVVLLKGARDFQFELLSKKLEVRTHNTVLEINLNAVLHNFHYYKSLLKPSTKIMGMVKAFAYGSGSLEVARMLQYHGCDYLAVAVSDEGVELRKAGIKLPIVVLATERESFQGMIEHRLEPEIYGFSILSDLIFELRQRKIKEYPIHIKVDTGMHRFGFLPEEIERLVGILNLHSEVKVCSVFSHLAASGEPEMDSFSNEQLRQFTTLVGALKKKLPYSFFTHVLNTSGIERFPDYQMDMVRLGIGMYGVSSKKSAQLRNVFTFKTNIAQIRKVGAQQSVGYSRVGWTTRESRIATVPVGYADGLDRRLSNGVGQFWVNGKIVPTIGNICMDLTMLDVTDVEVTEGDEVLLMGDEIRVESWAKNLQTIPYEVLTNISQRVKRVYLTE